MPIHLKLTFSNSKMYAVTPVYLSRMEVDLPSTGLVYSMPRLVENQNGHGRGECPGICPLSSELHKMEDQAEACCLNLREMSSELKKVNAQTTGSCLNLGQISIELARVNEEGGTLKKTVHIYFFSYFPSKLPSKIRSISYILSSGICCLLSSGLVVFLVVF